MSHGRHRDILIMGPPAGRDPSVEQVVAALRRRGVEPWRFDTTRFPGGLSLSFAADGGVAGTLDGRDLASVGAVWVRHFDPGGALPEDLDPAHRQVCVDQATAALWSLLDCLDAYVLDPPVPLLGSPRKPGMQRMAARLGLDVPRSLVSNDPDAVRAFAATCPGGIVGKLIESGGVSLQGAAGPSAFPTFAVTPEDLETLAGLSLSPLLFQERLVKRHELRLTVVGPKVFVAAIEPGDVVDWRGDAAVVASFRAYDGLPAPVQARVLALLDELGLDFATVDLVHTPDDRWVFLEANSISFFDHVERHAGLPISEAVADLLLGDLPSRTFWASR